MKVKNFFKEARKEMDKAYKEAFYEVKDDILKCIETLPENANLEYASAIVIDYITGEAYNGGFWNLRYWLENDNRGTEYISDPSLEKLDFSKKIMAFQKDYIIEGVFCLFSEKSKVYVKIRKSEPEDDFLEEHDFYLRNFPGYEGIVEEKEFWRNETVTVKFDWSFFER